MAWHGVREATRNCRNLAAQPLGPILRNRVEIGKSLFLGSEAENWDSARVNGETALGAMRQVVDANM